MRRILTVFLFSAVVLPLAAQPFRAALHNDRPTMETLYDSLAELRTPERRAFAAGQTSNVKADLWLLHFEKVLMDHPELTAAERGVVLEAMGLVSSGVVNFDVLLPEQTPMARASVEALEQRAIQVFPRQLLALTFGTIGRPYIGKTGSPKWRLFPTISIPDCECNVGSIFTCGGLPTSPEYCNPSLPPSSCTWIISGCGFLWAYPCDGLCKSTPPPPPTP